MKFNTKKKLLSHHNVEHATDAQFVCQKCGKRCGSASQLRLHARQVNHRDFIIKETCRSP